VPGIAPKNVATLAALGLRRAFRRTTLHLDGRRVVLRAWLRFGPPRSRLSLVGQLTEPTSELAVHLSVGVRRSGARRYELVGAGRLGGESCRAHGVLSDEGSGPELCLHIESRRERLSFRAGWQELPPAILAAGAAFECVAVGAADSGRGIVMRLDYRDLLRSWTEWQYQNRPSVQ
jgi:hypothetical protein